MPDVEQSPDRWRLVRSEFADGRTNMAIDEAIMTAVAEGKAPPTLRFYGWEPFCLSIGYTQSMRREVDLEACEKAGIDCVRRPTGGRAVLHGDELTYSLIIPQEERRVAGGIVESYRRLSMGFVEGLGILGAQACQAEPHYGGARESSAACFDAPSHYEVTVSGRKLVGSAQMRRKGMVLQHGAIPLCGDVTRIMDYLKMPSEEVRERLRRTLAAKAITVSEAVGRTVTFEEVAAAFEVGLARTLEVEWVEAELSEEERELSRRLRLEKYDTDDWNFMR